MCLPSRELVLFQLWERRVSRVASPSASPVKVLRRPGAERSYPTTRKSLFSKYSLEYDVRLHRMLDQRRYQRDFYSPQIAQWHLSQGISSLCKPYWGFLRSMIRTIQIHSLQSNLKRGQRKRQPFKNLSKSSYCLLLVGTIYGNRIDDFNSRESLWLLNFYSFSSCSLQLQNKIFKSLIHRIGMRFKSQSWSINTILELFQGRDLDIHTHQGSKEWYDYLLKP